MALTAERLREVAAYDPATGFFIWRIDRGYRGSRGKAGGRAGSQNKSSGYREIGIDGRVYLEHRLAVLYMTGEWPISVVDHVRNGERGNNQAANLRPATRAQNRANTKHKKSGTTSALRGVSWHRRARKWQAQIIDNGEHVHLGLFTEEEAAHAAYRMAALRIHGEFANV